MALVPGALVPLPQLPRVAADIFIKILVHTTPDDLRWLKSCLNFVALIVKNDTRLNAATQALIPVITIVADHLNHPRAIVHGVTLFFYFIHKYPDIAHNFYNKEKYGVHTPPIDCKDAFLAGCGRACDDYMNAKDKMTVKDLCIALLGVYLTPSMQAMDPGLPTHRV